ncbi:hypothetical protein B0J11DRAFT_313377 [Dendryphion nanum]|uniref:Large ribosomal subunit protein bL32m n=1 Tax=Dendryphion nanum TaxID=256645 RepID=A0A9P9DSB4_9PLEO|nr:hypothetical protein B0J11DRAFT_313377 [Dendryphion nanum]
MALARPLPPLWQSLIPALNGSIRPVINLPLLHRLQQPFRLIPTPFAALALPSFTFPSIPSLADIWEGVLKAVPKKKTSHRKKRQRFMAGKGLKDIVSTNRCSACGRIKRAHILCPYCVHSLKAFLWWGVDSAEKAAEFKGQAAPIPKKMRKQNKREEIEERKRKRSAEPIPTKGPGILGKQWRW